MKDDLTTQSVKLLTEIVKTGGSLTDAQMQRAIEIVTNAQREGIDVRNDSLVSEPRASLIETSSLGGTNSVALLPHHAGLMQAA